MIAAKIPKAVYGTGPTTLLFTVPQGPPSPGRGEGAGGSDISGAGVPAAFRIRTDPRLRVDLRFTEGEWLAVLAMIDHGQSGGIIYWYPDQTISMNYTCYLDQPTIGRDFESKRAQYNGHMGIEIVLRRTTPADFGAEYFTS